MKKTLALLLLLAGLSVEAQGRTLYWTGDYSFYWNDLESHKNWKDEDGNVVAFQDGDDVVFHNCDASFIEVWGVSPGSMLVDNSAGKLYTFDRDVSGGGSINGNMNLTKRGEGNLIIECACNYTGDTFIYGGTTSIKDERPRPIGDKEPAWLGHGDIFLYGGCLQLFSSQPYANDIYVKGEATLNCQELGGSLTVENTGKLTLDAALNIRGGNLILQDGAMVNVGEYAVSFFGGAGAGGLIKVDGNATLGNGEIIACKLNVAAGKTLTLMANTSATYGTNFNLGEGSSLDMGGNSVSFADTTISSSGDGGYLGHGTIEGDLTVTSGSRINLLENTTVTGGVNLGDNASLDLGKNAVTANTLTFNGDSATIGNGTVKLLADLTGEGTIVFGEDTMVDMNGYTLSRAFSLAGDTTFTNGKVLLTDNVSGEGTFILGEGVTLDTNFRTISNKITLSGSTVTILRGNFDNDLTVGKGQTLIVTGTSMTGKGTLYLGDGATLRQKPTPISSYITNAVMVTGNATIDNGNLSNWVTVAPGVKLTVSGSLNMANSSSIALQDGAILDLGGGSDINARVYVGGDAFVGNGCVNKEIRVNSPSKLTLFDSLTCIDIGSQETSTGITLQNNAAVDLGGKTHIIDVRAYGNASIGNGTLDGSVTANHDSSLNFFGETRIKGGTQIPGGTQNPDKTATSGLVTVGNTTIKSLDNANPGLLKELSVSNGLIAGTDRCTSLADGLYIESTADLMIKNMTITANNELHAGYMLTNTVTLNQVTIDLSEANFKLVGSDYYFQVQSLINCTLEMDDVVFDASALELPEDFDPAENGIGFDFGDDVFIGKTEATLLMGDHWSQTVSVSLGDRGQMVFSALVPMTPEPTTGTLGLLALAALAARRRK